MFRQTVSTYPDTPALGHKEGEEWKKISYSVNNCIIKVTIWITAIDNNILICKCNNNNRDLDIVEGVVMWYSTDHMTYHMTKEHEYS